MRRVLRISAIAIAVAGVVDPAFPRRAAVLLPVDILMPRASDSAHGRAVRIRERIASALEGRAVLDGADAAQAVIAIGPAVLPDAPGVPLFSLALATTPSVSIQGLRAPSAVRGQSAPVVATLRAVGLAGRTSSITLARRGTAVDHVTHQWKTDDELFEARLGFVPGDAGVHRVRVEARTSGLKETATADLAIVIRDRRLRVLAYEPRPSWPVAFVRRSLEADPLFDVTGTARTTSRSATTSGGAPASLAALQADRIDAILVGAPEALSDADARILDAFVSRRGGALIFLPDRALTEPVRRRFGLPEFEEVVLEGPLTMQPPGPSLRASELLLAPWTVNGPASVRAVRHGDRDRGLIVSFPRGAGHVIVSGALDAWRFRADPEAPFDMFWRGLVADAAASAPPKLTVTIEPSIARPGDDLAVSVTLRPTELTTRRGAVEVPGVEAELLATGGGGEVIRLWPDVTPGVYTSRLKAPRPGEYLLSVSAAGSSADTPLLVAEAVVHPASGGSKAAALAAETSGGAVVVDVGELVNRLATFDAADVERRTRPMRSPWWILPFAGLLCAEWALRRRGGLR